MTAVADRSALPLLVARIGAQHPNDAVAADNLAVAAHFLDRSSDFHRFNLFK
jgi:hypothetical protein